MDMNYTEDDLRFRDDVRAFIDEAFTPDLQQQMSRSKNGYMSKEPYYLAKAPSEKGWAAQIGRQSMAGQGSRRHRSSFSHRKWMPPARRISFLSVCPWWHLSLWLRVG